MADATFNDVLEEQKRTNGILERDGAGRALQTEALRERITELRESLGNIIRPINTRLFRDQLDQQSLSPADQVDTTDSLPATNESVVELTESTTSGLESVREAIFSLISRNNRADNDNRRNARDIRLRDNLDGRERITELRESLGKIMSPFGKALGKLGGAIGGGARRGARNALDFLKNTLGKIIGAGLLVGMLAFFNSQAFKRMVAWFQGPGLEMIANFYDKIFKPAIVIGFTKLKDMFVAIGDYFSKPEFKEAFRLIKEGKIFDALGLGLRTITDDLGKQFGIENLSEKIGNALAMFYNAIAGRLNFIISGLNLFGTDIPKLPIFNVETGKFETAEEAAERERIEKLEENIFVGKEVTRAFAPPGENAELDFGGAEPDEVENAVIRRVASGMAGGIRGYLGVRAAPIDIMEAQEKLKDARAFLKKSIEERDKISESVEYNLAQTIAAQEKGNIATVNALETQMKALRIMQEKVAKKTEAAQNQLNNVVYAQNNSPSNTTIAGSTLGSMRPSSEVTDALSRSMAF